MKGLVVWGITAVVLGIGVCSATKQNADNQCLQVEGTSVCKMDAHLEVPLLYKQDVRSINVFNADGSTTSFLDEGIDGTLDYREDVFLGSNYSFTYKSPPAGEATLYRAFPPRKLEKKGSRPIDDQDREEFRKYSALFFW